MITVLICVGALIVLGGVYLAGYLRGITVEQDTRNYVLEARLKEAETKRGIAGAKLYLAEQEIKRLKELNDL